MVAEKRKHPFVSFLEEHAEDRAMLAQLRRGLGRLPGEVPSMFPYVVPFVHRRHEEANLYMLASLFALHPVSIDEGNMGSHVYRYTRVVGDDSTATRRFMRLLNLRRDTLDSPLRQYISIFKSKNIPVNWHRLLIDLNYWDHDARYVQKNWARGYWGSTDTEDNSSS